MNHIQNFNAPGRTVYKFMFIFLSGASKFIRNNSQFEYNIDDR